MSKAIIIGGGIGGLSAAAALMRVGVECEVFEQAAELREVGAGLTLWANAIRALRQLGIAETVVALGSKLDSMEVRTWSGQILATNNLVSLERKLGVPANVVAHRADLLRELARLTDSRRLHCHSRCVRFVEATGSVTAWFEDGREVHADFLIGADGLHSTVRQRLHGAVKPRYAGYTCWRGVANLQPETMRNAGFEAWGPGARFAVYPCGPRRVFWYATRNMKEGEADSLRGRKADVQEMFGRWHSPIPDVIEATQGTDIVRNDIVDRPPSRLWGRGRMTLLGDAAHPTTPNLGQGACQAIEDAIVLADQLRRAGNTEGALRAYEKLRQRRTARITTESFRLGRVGQWENSVACWLRNTGTRFFPQSASLRLMERFFKTALPEL